MSISDSNQAAPATIAILGATGGVANAILVHALRSSKNVIVLARTPSKLTTQLHGQKITPETIATHLTIIAGDALDKTALKKTLTANNTPNHLVTHIVSSLGASPSLRWHYNPMQCVTIDNPDLCGSAARTLVETLNDLYGTTEALRAKKPTLTFVSTTGISDKTEDVPFGIQTLYHAVLAVPHKDKRAMERTFRENIAGSDAVFSSVIGVRPTLLTGGVDADQGVGVERVRAGTEMSPAKGYSVCRADVGEWIWVNLVSDEDKRREWEGEMVSLA